jgi:hypothetical protein
VHASLASPEVAAFPVLRRCERPFSTLANLKNRSLDARGIASELGHGTVDNKIRENRMAKHSHVNRFSVTSIVVLLLLNCGSVIAQTQQEHVHSMSHGVMPFDMTKTIHIFKMTEFGGVQRVIVKDRSYVDQVMLIRQHLREEAGRFQHGDYSDPATLHGLTMPGLKELQLGAQRVKVSYSDLPDGAEITFETLDLPLLTAIHRWFGAQLSEHGADAKAE